MLLSIILSLLYLALCLWLKFFLKVFNNKFKACKRELHRVFSQPNPEHVNGLPTHPRSKEAAELWLQHYQKEVSQKSIYYYK